ncbi:hypothetical protein F2Q70_00017945 [Brassica cretica]|uniref:Uncharacterized protein n=1 Tax=Brassica cretica TaxID=69181 RepID=A0A8S9I2Y8_BRACR|nr:hypothetical protein F2Q70_00017945 [Brassica cretica]
MGRTFLRANLALRAIRHIFVFVIRAATQLGNCRLRVLELGISPTVLVAQALTLFSRPRSASAQGVPDPSSDVRDPRAAPARDLFLVRDSIRQLASDDQSVPDQATKDVRDPIEATRSIPARVPFVSSSRLNSGRYVATELFRNVDTTISPCILVYPSMLSPEDRSEPITRSPPF